MLFGCWFTVNTISQLWLCSWWPQDAPLPFPSPPFINTAQFPTFNRDANLDATFARTTASFLTSQPGDTQLSSTLLHCRTVYDIFSVLFVLFHGARLGGRRESTRPPLRGEKQTPMWTPWFCPCPLPGRFSLWCILALGNIDLNALFFDLNQLLPVYLYR